MILFKIELVPIFNLCLLLLPITATCYEAEPFEDKSLPESKQLYEFYHSPMLSINRLLSKAMDKCKRMPSNKEFKHFILNGGHEHIRCSEKITIINDQIPEFGQLTGKNLPHLPEFLNRNQYQIYSDTKMIYVILKPKPSEWKYKYFKVEDYEFVVQCTIGMEKCNLSKIKDWASSCRASKTFAKNFCYLGDKKIIDY